MSAESVLAQNYRGYWESEGVRTITPQGLDQPEGFDPVAWVQEFRNRKSGSIITEFGCGIGRLARSFRPEYYIGVDFNSNAIATARLNHPDHDFRLVDLASPIPRGNTVFAYTVFLHVPDELIKVQLVRCLNATRERFIIAEIMFDITGARRNGMGTYHTANNRSPERYGNLLDELGWRVVARDDRPYEYYRTRDPKDITLLAFERK